MPGAVASLPTLTSGRHQVRRRALQGRTNRPSGGGTAARALEATRLDCSALLVQLAQRRDRGEVPSMRSLPTEGSPHVAAALRVAWRTLGRGRRADGGSGASVDTQQYDTTHFAISLPHSHVVRQNTLSSSWFRFRSKVTTMVLSHGEKCSLEGTLSVHFRQAASPTHGSSSPSRHPHASPTSCAPFHRRVPAASQTNSRLCLYHGSQQHVRGPRLTC